MTNLPYLVLRI